MRKHSAHSFSGLFLCTVAIAILLGATFLRCTALDSARIHGDEAVQATKSWDFSHYAYDPTEFHGPTLQLLTQPLLWGVDSSTDVDISRLRQVTATIGVLLVLLVWLGFRRQLGAAECIAATLFLTLSPLLVHTSRSYIHETLLLAATVAFIGSGWHAYSQRSNSWAAICGGCVGIMWATKETAVLALASTGLALLWGRVSARISSRPKTSARSDNESLDTSSCDLTSPGLTAKQLLVATVSCGGVAFLLFSLCFQQPGAFVDALTTFASYSERAADTDHHHPWYDYLLRLSYFQNSSGPIWSEASILLLALWGGVRAWYGRSPLLVFLTRYALLLTLIYSTIPYKTPWCAVQFHWVGCLLAGVGAADLLRRAAAHSSIMRWTSIVLLTLISSHLALQSWRTSRHYASDPRSPHVYAEPLSGVHRLAQWLPKLEKAKGSPLLIVVIEPNPWPLPWLLRAHTQVGYWATTDAFANAAFSNDVAASVAADLIVVGQGAEPWLRERYPNIEVFYYGLRREETLVVGVSKKLYQRFADGSR